MKTFLKVIACILVACLGFASGVVTEYYASMPESDKFVDGEISFHFLHLGNGNTGDSIYIKCGDDDILIDAGSRSNSAPTIINYVDQFVTDGKLEYVIATHSDQDHIAAFPSTSSYEGIFDHYDTGIIIDFPKTDKTTDTKILTNYYLARDKEVENGAKHFTALQCYNNEGGAERVYELSGGVKMEILYNYYYEHKAPSENDNSVCLLFSQGDNHYLFTGDLEEDGEEKLVEFYNEQGNPLPQCKLYKAGHHGSKTSSSLTLLNQIKPEIVAVCCVAGSKEYTKEYNSNTFPTQTFIDNVAPFTKQVYVTGLVEIYEEDGKDKERGVPLNGNIVISFNGSQTKMEFSGSDKPLKDSDWFKENRVCPSAWK